jgi:hypothetical protein
VRRCLPGGGVNALVRLRSGSPREDDGSGIGAADGSRGSDDPVSFFSVQISHDFRGGDRGLAVLRRADGKVEFGQSRQITTCTPDTDWINDSSWIGLSWSNHVAVIGICRFCGVAVE